MVGNRFGTRFGKYKIFKIASIQDDGQFMSYYIVVKDEPIYVDERDKSLSWERIVVPL